MPLVDDIWTTTDTETGPTATVLNRISGSVRVAVTALKARATVLEARKRAWSATGTTDATGLVVFAIPVGTFTAAPVATASVGTTTQNAIAMIEAVTTTSINVRVRYWTGSWSSAAGFGVAVTAVGA